MLSLTRKVGSDVRILVPGSDNGITVRVTRIKGNSVSLSFDAPEDFRIMRAEVLERGQDGKQAN